MNMAVEELKTSGGIKNCEADEEGIGKLEDEESKLLSPGW